MSVHPSRGARVAAACCAVALAAGAAAAAPSWPQPAYDAAQTWSNPHETTLSRANVVRLQRIAAQQPGALQAGWVTQSAGTLFVCTDTLGLDAIDQSTGASRWSFYQFAGGQCLAAVLDADSAYATAWAAPVQGVWTNTLTALDRRDGSPRWQVFGPADDPLQASYLGFTEPTLWQGGLYVNHGRSLVAAYDAATGAQRWSAATGCLNRQPAVDAGLVFTATWAECGSANLVFAHRAGDGSLAWSQPTDASPSEFPAAVSGGRVIVGSDSGAVFAFDEASGTPLWTARFAQYVSQAPAATPQAVLVASGRNQLAALDARSGRPLWQATLPGADAFSSNLVLANGVAYLVGSDASGNQHLLAYDARSGKRLARLADVIFGQHADLSVVDGRVYVTAAGALIVYGLQ